MFTGIIEEIGTVMSIEQGRESMVVRIQAMKVLEDVHLGDSIAVNGVCLTVTSFTNKEFTADVMNETVRATAMNSLKKGSKVNLERAMKASGRFGGHMVSGHVDGTGIIIGKKQVANAIYYEIEIDPALHQYVMMKGSIAIDGTSLTVFGLGQRSFTVSLIPHTQLESILGMKEIGDIVNIECDMLAKYVEHFLSRPMKRNQKSSITSSFLEEHGFI